MMYGTEDEELTAATSDMEAATAFMIGFVDADAGWPGQHRWRPA